MDSQLLLNQIAEGDEVAFASLVNIYSQSCYRIAWRQVFDIQIAEDIVQEVMLTIWRKPLSWQSGKGCKFETWLYRVVVNRCIDYLRKQKRKAQTSSYEERIEAGEDIPSIAFEPEATRLRDEQQYLLQESIKSLDERAQTAINLYYYEEMSHKQVAEIMDTTPKAIESLVARARKDLRKIHERMQSATA